VRGLRAAALSRGWRATTPSYRPPVAGATNGVSLRARAGRRKCNSRPAPVMLSRQSHQPTSRHWEVSTRKLAACCVADQGSRSHVRHLSTGVCAVCFQCARLCPLLPSLRALPCPCCSALGQTRRIRARCAPPRMDRLSPTARGWPTLCKQHAITPLCFPTALRSTRVSSVTATHAMRCAQQQQKVCRLWCIGSWLTCFVSSCLLLAGACPVHRLLSGELPPLPQPPLLNVSLRDGTRFDPNGKFRGIMHAQGRSGRVVLCACADVFVSSAPLCFLQAARPRCYRAWVSLSGVAPTRRTARVHGAPRLIAASWWISNSSARCKCRSVRRGRHSDGSTHAPHQALTSMKAA
jgi:hypothetical protein